MPRDAAARPPAKRPAPQPRDPEASRARILAAATAEFARHGLSGGRVDRIAERARANKRMLYYYYGGKESLFLAVLEAAYARIRGEEQKLDLSKRPPAEGMRELVTFTWRHFLAHPEFISLLNTENLHRAKHLKRSSRIQSLHSPLVAMISDLLERGARAGVFRPGVDPVQLYVSIAALGYFYLSNAWTLSTIFGRDLTAPKAKEARIEHIVDLVLGALAPPATPRPAPVPFRID
ncbi:MAG TPA: TetR/AcrR family transcriptional regulator [Casimicrobiaceae bacterium]|nr:TetR/AcrR family transcriptional regulator [Casimicrobiaceae bacterium]